MLTWFSSAADLKCDAGELHGAIQLITDALRQRRTGSGVNCPDFPGDSVT